MVGVRPGLIATEIHAPGRLERVGSTPPLGRPGTAEEVAAAVVWLASRRRLVRHRHDAGRRRRPLMWEPGVTERLRLAFVDADYTYDGVLGAIGEEAHRALGRNSALAGRPGAGRAGRPAGGADPAVAAAAARDPDGAGARPARSGRAAAGGRGAGPRRRSGPGAARPPPYAADDEPIWIVSDLTPGLDTVLAPIRPDFVLGVSSASARWPSSPSAARSARRSISAPAAASSRSTWPGTPNASWRPTSTLGRCGWPEPPSSSTGSRPICGWAACTGRWPGSASTWSSPTRRT